MEKGGGTHWTQTSFQWNLIDMETRLIQPVCVQWEEAVEVCMIAPVDDGWVSL